eukprot:TRINITY_DN1804_c0_g1_i1.p1 TRINITY_DN1804_c0_g1~~TRINITY_DN1804_c0_g1_i1.p1  ORF type:complete len:223 (-),score=20.47 TRINITY_DN1804_c0_g1_i1:75-743(-)
MDDRNQSTQFDSAPRRKRINNIAEKYGKTITNKTRSMPLKPEESSEKDLFTSSDFSENLPTDFGGSTGNLYPITSPTISPGTQTPSETTPHKNSSSYQLQDIQPLMSRISDMGLNAMRFLDLYFHSQTFTRYYESGKQMYVSMIGNDARISLGVNGVILLLLIWLISGTVIFVWKISVFLFVCYSTFQTVDRTVKGLPHRFQSYSYGFYFLMILYLFVRLIM